MSDELMINIKHAKALKYCSKGVRNFFNKHGLDYSAFVTTGVPASKIMATNDLMAIRMVEVARVGK